MSYIKAFHKLYLILGLFSLSITISYSQTIVRPNTTVKITKEWDLGGRSLELPTNVVLEFNGGYISNGKIIGNNTQLNGVLDKIFCNVNIEGTWNVPVISTKMFHSLDYDNSLRDILALANDDIFNEVTIEEGYYYITIDKEAGTGLLIRDKISLKIDGHIVMKPNSFLACNILKVVGNNVLITGDGTISGDKFTHSGSEGEWGMGIMVSGSENVCISNLTIKDCWGDCIYVGFNAKNIIIDNCRLDNGRRQGVSVTSGSEITISNCFITNINGTPPEYGIDIEPNKGDTVVDVVINNCSISNSYGGIKCWGGAKDATIKTIEISNCRVTECVAKHPMTFEVADRLSIKDCYVEADFTSPIYLSRIDNAVLHSVELKTFNLRPIVNVNCGKVKKNNINIKIK